MGPRPRNPKPIEDDEFDIWSSDDDLASFSNPQKPNFFDTLSDGSDDNDNADVANSSAVIVNSTPDGVGEPKGSSSKQPEESISIEDLDRRWALLFPDDDVHDNSTSQSQQEQQLIQNDVEPLESPIQPDQHVDVDKLLEQFVEMTANTSSEIAHQQKQGVDGSSVVRAIISKSVKDDHDYIMTVDTGNYSYIV